MIPCSNVTPNPIISYWLVTLDPKYCVGSDTRSKFTVCLNNIPQVLFIQHITLIEQVQYYEFCSFEITMQSITPRKLKT